MPEINLTEMVSYYLYIFFIQTEYVLENVANL